MENIQNYRGCLLGGAVGDALGYPIEFLHELQIFQTYGKSGLTEYQLLFGVAQISDDTQMTLFTASGLLSGATNRAYSGDRNAYLKCIARSYKDWLETQSGNEQGQHDDNRSWLARVPELNHARAPGITCMKALRSGRLGTIAQPINNSKGCGGLMRVAPIGLFLHDRCSSDGIDMLAAEAAALTHGHELGYIPAAILVHIVNLVSHQETNNLHSAVADAMATAKRLFPHAHYMDDLVSLIQKAVMLSQRRQDDLDAIHQLGAGWVAEETLAIAIYCALKHQDDFEQAVIAAANHSGDSDSTGSVTGSILGAMLGSGRIPEKFLVNLEIREIIMKLADDLYRYSQPG